MCCHIQRLFHIEQGTKTKMKRDKAGDVVTHISYLYYLKESLSFDISSQFQYQQSASGPGCGLHRSYILAFYTSEQLCGKKK